LREKNHKRQPAIFTWPTEGINQHSLDEYCKLFTGSSYLLGDHVKAMAALFGWATQEDIEEMVAAA